MTYRKAGPGTMMRFSFARGTEPIENKILQNWTQPGSSNMFLARVGAQRFWVFVLIKWFSPYFH